MPELKERFHALARTPAPDLWPEIRERKAVDAPNRRWGARRVAVVALALLVAAIGIALPLRAFLPKQSPGPGVSPGSPSPTPTLPFDPRVVGTVPVGSTLPPTQRGGATSVFVAAGAAWVSGYGLRNEQDQLLERVDPSTDRIVATIPLEGVPAWEWGGGGMAYGDGSLWVVGASEKEPVDGIADAILQRIDTRTNRIVDVIGLGGWLGADVSIGPDAVWVALFGTHTAQVARLDPSTDRVVSVIDLGSPYARRIVATDRAVVVEELLHGNGGEPLIEVIDPRSNKIVASDFRHWQYASIARWGDEVWATTPEGFTRVDTATAAPTGQPVVAEEPSAGFPSVTARDGIWFVAGGVLYRFDPDAGSVERIMDVSNLGSIALAVGDDSAWLLGYEGELTHVALR